MATKGVQPSRSQRRHGNCLGQHQRLLSEATARGQMKLPRASSRTASASIGLREDILSLSLAFPPLFLKNPRHLYLLKGMRLTAGLLYYVVFFFCDTCRWKQSPTIFNFVTTFDEKLKSFTKVNPNFLCFTHVFITINPSEGLHLVSHIQLVMFMWGGERNSPCWSTQKEVWSDHLQSVEWCCHGFYWSKLGCYFKLQLYVLEQLTGVPLLTNLSQLHS